jgi:hypothetical protein
MLLGCRAIAQSSAVRRTSQGKTRTTERSGFSRSDMRTPPRPVRLLPAAAERFVKLHDAEEFTQTNLGER